MEREENPDHIPIDIILEILSRSSIKSIARFGLASKLCASIVRGPDFTELFLLRSSTRPPRLLFAINHFDKFRLYSSPQPQNADEKHSLVVAANFHMQFFGYMSPHYGPVSGLLYFPFMRISEEYIDNVPVICNCSTGQYARLPQLRSKRGSRSLLGYDPIGKQYKVNSNNLVRDQNAQKFQLDACTSDMSTSYFGGKSPFPHLDQFIESIASIGNVSGKIRCWYWFSEDSLILYSMLRNRYCERIGREHKSNHVMYIVDLRRGIYYQKCYDPDCRDYRSPIRPVPDSCLPEDMVHHQEDTQNLCDNLNYKVDCYVDNECDPDSAASRGSWWLEAVKVADDLESKPTLEPLTWENYEEDDDWWVAAEESLKQVSSLSPSPKYP